MFREVSKWFVNGLFHLPINGVYWGYNPLTNHLLTSWDILVPGFLWNSFSLELLGNGAWKWWWKMVIYPLVNEHSNGKSTIWRCISYWKKVDMHCHVGLLEGAMVESVKHHPNNPILNKSKVRLPNCLFFEATVTWGDPASMHPERWDSTMMTWRWWLVGAWANHLNNSSQIGFLQVKVR